MWLGSYWLDPIYMVLTFIVIVLLFLGLVYRIINQLTLLLKEIRDEEKRHTGQLENVTAPRIRIIFPEQQHERDTSGNLMYTERPSKPTQ